MLLSGFKKSRIIFDIKNDLKWRNDLRNDLAFVEIFPINLLTQSFFFLEMWRLSLEILLKNIFLQSVLYKKKKTKPKWTKNYPSPEHNTLTQMSHYTD